MKEQKFKFDHHTAIYHGGGKYTLIADEGYLMQSGTTQAKQVEVKDYTQWKAVEEPEAEAPELTETAGGEGENTETEAPAEEKTETEAPAEEPEKPADEQPAEEQPKTKKAKAAKAE